VKIRSVPLEVIYHTADHVLLAVEFSVSSLSWAALAAEVRLDEMGLERNYSWGEAQVVRVRQYLYHSIEFSPPSQQSFTECAQWSCGKNLCCWLAKINS